MTSAPIVSGHWANCLRYNMW